MSENSNHDQFKSELIQMSVSDNWNNAIQEWRVVDIYKLSSDEEDEFCLCGHPIRNICVVSNTVNEKQCNVGNICVKKFISEEPDQIFSSLDRIISDQDAGPSLELIKWAHERKIISDNEFKFCNDRFRSRKHSPKQLNWRRIINQKIIKYAIRKK